MKQQRIAVLSFDVEQDTPPFSNTWRGVEEGLPRVAQLLEEKKVKATFFFTGEALKRYPNKARELYDSGHEIGVHGYKHERLDRLDHDTACKTITKATNIARQVVGEVYGFRAPNLQLPLQLLKCLEYNSYTYDSSLAAYKPPFIRKPMHMGPLLEIPVTVTSSILRLPWPIQAQIHKHLSSIRVYFSHPWEYTRVKRVGIRLDISMNTGDKALTLLEKLIDYLTTNNFKITTAHELAKQLLRNTTT